MVRRALSLLLALVMLSTCSGCTLVGLGIGAAIPKRTVYGLQDPAGPALTRATIDDNLDVGDDMVVYTRRPPPAASPESPDSIEIGAPPPPSPVVPIPVVRIPREVSGRFHSLDQTTLHIDGDDYLADIPLERIEKVRVSHGSLWLPGMVMGMVCDGVAASIVTWIILSMKGIR